MDLSGRTAVVTGGAYSLGRAFAEALAGAGADVALFDIRPGAEAARDIAAAHGARVRAWEVDVSDEDRVAAAVAEVAASLGGPDILVNNAALFAELPRTPVDELSLELWLRVMTVNAAGPFLMIKHCLPRMKEAGWGRIVNISSGTAYKGMPGMSAYIASKAALVGLTRAVSREVGAHGITVNTLAPGLTETPSVMDHPRNLANHDQVLASRAIRRSGRSEDLTAALLFMVSEGAGFMTGQTVAVDGGSINV